jgi:hypothetical protein
MTLDPYLCLIIVVFVLLIGFSILNVWDPKANVIYVARVVLKLKISILLDLWGRGHMQMRTPKM